MKNITLILLSSVLLNGCSIFNNNSSNRKIYTYTFNAYYDYEINKNIDPSTQKDNPRLLYSYEGNHGSTLQFNVNDYGIKNVIGGDSITVHTYANDFYFLQSYPSIISIPDIITQIEINETNVYKFEVQTNENNELFFYCLDNNTTYSYTNKIITNHLELTLAEDYEIYDSMILYGTLDKNNQIDSMFTYNPRVNNTSYQLESLYEQTYTLLEIDNEFGTFINDYHIIKTNITGFNDLTIGNEYKLMTNSKFTLIKNYKNIEYMIKPLQIEPYKNYMDNNMINIKIYCYIDAYDGMPTYDENGNYINTHRYWYTSYNYFHYNSIDPISFNEIYNSSSLKENLYIPHDDIEIFNNYRAFDFFNENTSEYKLDKDTLITENTILFISEPSSVTYM